MRNHQETAPLGEVVAAVFDAAAQYCLAPEEVAWLSTRVVAHLLRRPLKPLARSPRRE